MSPFITTFILFLPFILAATVSSSIIHETCKAATAFELPIDYEFCTSSLQADPRSENANKHELALIATQLSLKNVTAINNIKIPLLIKSGNYSKRIKEILQTCSDRFFSFYIQSLTEAVDSFNKGNYSNTYHKIFAVWNSKRDCDNEFDEEDDPQDPLMADYHNVGGLTSLAMFLIRRIRLNDFATVSASASHASACTSLFSLCSEPEIGGRYAGVGRG